MSLYMREYVCVKAWASAEGCIWEKGKTSMVSTQVLSSKGMYIRVWMLFTSVFTCICYRMCVHKISLSCHKCIWWVKRVTEV